jgi:chemosensory pili system protein ChpA (sensor histidine kinase/response regulator)
MTKVRTILYAEDDLVVLTVYKKRLEAAGFHVIPARDGLEAIKNLSIFVPDLVLLDLLMPKFNGEEVLQFIRNNPRFAKVPVIILSTNSIRDVAQEPMLEQADQRLIKSKCTAETLVESIQYLLAGANVEKSEERISEIEDSFSSVFRTASAI